MSADPPPIGATLRKVSSAALGEPALVADALDIVEWRRSPQEWCGGRAAWQPLSNPARTLIGGRALKFKGVGLCPRQGMPARPPSNEPYDRWDGQAPDLHFGIRGDLELVLRASEPAPLGGMLLSRALNEFTCATELQARNVCAVRPFAVLELRGAKFAVGSRSEPLGVSVTVSPVVSPLRCSVLLDDWRQTSQTADDELRRLAALLDIGTSLDDAARFRIRAVAEAYRRFGRTLASFSSAGWHRYSGHADNIVIGDDGNAVLIDLDSCVRSSGLGDAVALENIRDGMSGLYNLACAFFSTVTLELIPDEMLIEEEPFSAFLAGWTSTDDAAHQAAGRLIASYVVESRKCLRQFSSFLGEPTRAARHLYRFVRHDRDLTYALLYRIAFEASLKQPAVSDLPFDLDALDSRLFRFAGRGRFEELQEWFEMLR